MAPDGNEEQQNVVNKQEDAQEAHGTNQGALWGGRFSTGPSPELEKLSRSTHFDFKLAAYDLAGSGAHVRALAEVGLLTGSQLETILQAISVLEADVSSGAWVPAESDEDIHGALETELINRIGADLGGRIRAGRSRNDQIATLIRLYLLDHAEVISKEIAELISALATHAEQYAADPMPGRTHLQHAQPITLGHHLLAHAWPLVRDLQRISNWRARASVSAYGSGALAGNAFGLNMELIAGALGLDDVAENSLDATAARDVVAEFAFISAMVGVNLSRLAEEIILWGTKEFGYIRLHDSWSTGSSIMPQKKNPDIAELARGKTGRLIGNLTGLLTMLKGLPLAYNRDLQEDKEAIFDSVETLEVLLPAFTGMVATLEFNLARMREQASAGYSLTTDVADYLVRKGIPFRDAHEITGALVQLAERSGKELEELSDAELLSISSYLDAGVRSVLSVDASLSTRSGSNGTSPASVKLQLQKLAAAIQSITNF